MLESSDCACIPVDPFAIAAKCGYAVITYSSLGLKGERAALKKSESGFELALEDERGETKRYIYVNDRQSYQRQRFTVLHELGHIVLGHLQESDVAEAEANFFAKFCIAPPSLVHLIRPTNYIDIAETFCLSSECALNSWNYYRGWLSIYGEKDYEKSLAKVFVMQTGRGPRLRLSKSVGSGYVA